MDRWWSIGRIAGIPVRLHWSVLLGVVFFSGFHFAPGAWLGLIVVILVHELGHAAFVRGFGQHVVGIDVHGLGGETRWAGAVTPIRRALIAWGGVFAQLALFVVALPVSWALAGWLGSFGAEFFYAITMSSLFIAALNLIPFGRFDGAEAWKLPGLLVARWRNRGAPPPVDISPQFVAPKDDELARLFSRIADDARDARKPRHG